MRLTLVLCGCFLSLCLFGGAMGGRGRIGGSFGKIFGKKKPSPPRGGDSYPKQKYDAPDSKPPPYNPSYGGPPPPYSKNPPPYPQHGGNAQPPPYGWNPGQQGGGHNPGGGYHQPGYNPGGGYQQGGYNPGGGYGNYNPGGGGGGYGNYNPGGFNNAPHPAYNPQYNTYQSKSSGFPSIIPIPIPIPLGGGGFGYPGGYGGYNSFSGWHPNGDKKSGGKDGGGGGDGPPRVMAPPDGELEGVTELPAQSNVPQWTVFAKQKDKDMIKIKDDD